VAPGDDVPILRWTGGGYDELAFEARLPLPGGTRLARDQRGAEGNTLRLFQTWCAVFLSTVIAVVISTTWLDKPIAILVHDTFGQSGVLGSFTGTPSFYSPLVIFILLVLFVRRLAFRPFGKLDMVLILCDVSIILAKLIMPPLKVLFGRTWPQYARPSLIRDGVYGFHFLHSGPGFESFPSGHMASISALITVLWIYYPKYRPIYAAVTVAMAGGLIVGNYHFLSDVFAGSFVGFSTGVFVVSLWEAWNWHRVQSAFTCGGKSS
jgi:membrane-associated phospholipid phosphatase